MENEFTLKTKTKQEFDDLVKEIFLANQLTPPNTSGLKCSESDKLIVFYNPISIRKLKDKNYIDFLKLEESI